MCFWIFSNALLWYFRCLRRLLFYFSIQNRNIYIYIFFINVLLWIWFFNWQGSGHYLCQVLFLPRHLVIMFPTFCWLRCGLQSILFYFSPPFGEVHTIVFFSLCWNRVMSTVNCKISVKWASHRINAYGSWHPPKIYAYLFERFKLLTPVGHTNRCSKSIVYGIHFP